MKNIVKLLILLSPLFGMTTVTADTAVIGLVRISSTLITDDGRWGGCMASVSEDIATTGLDCPGRFVTFSCTGDFTPTNRAWKMYESAQIAMALGSQVRILVDDAQKHNGYCFAKQVYLYP